MLRDPLINAMTNPHDIEGEKDRKQDPREPRRALRDRSRSRFVRPLRLKQTIRGLQLERQAKSDPGLSGHSLEATECPALTRASTSRSLSPVGSDAAIACASASPELPARPRQ